MIPASYPEWKKCIVLECGIQLSESYILRRIAELKDSSHPRTIQFTNLYGIQHTLNVIQWFEQALNENQKT